MRSELSTPFPPRVSPDVERARTHGLAWARRTGLVSSRRSADYWEAAAFHEHAALYWPYAVGEDADLATDLMTFYFYIDDQFDTALGRSAGDAAGVIDPLCAITFTEGTTDSTAPLAVAFADLWRRIIPPMSTAWRQRAGRNWRDYLTGYVTESATRSHRFAFDDADLYLAHRRLALGAETSTDLIERFGNCEVPLPLFNCPHLLAMRRLSCDWLLYANDLHSADKEAAHGEVNNMIAVTRRREDCSLPEATALVRQRADRMMDRFRELEQQIPAVVGAFPDPGYPRIAEHYIAGLKAGMAGYNAWGDTTARYDLVGTDVALAHLEDLTTDR
ncbi:hypothetical protein ACFO4E_13860 [Nocardiopsis mangrovi]|uniref:Terpene synthase n=1 Tax=Nocardiopsis mangrovi TaxID=1179818 RepID=A0ABV9DX93_9ACTN